jgi:hypothetical protein
MISVRTRSEFTCMIGGLRMSNQSMKNARLAVFIAASFLCVSAPSSAHHSQAVYDENKLLTITGVVTKFEWSNPHVIVHLEVKDDKGSTDEWIAFSGSPSMQLREAGWNSEEFKPGETVTIKGFPQKDGRKIMLGAKHFRANGEEVSESIAEQRIYQGYLDRQAKDGGKD